MVKGKGYDISDIQVPSSIEPKKACRFNFAKENYIATLIVSAVLINCVLIVIASYFFLKKYNYCQKGKTSIVEQYHNYRQEASVTTPLMGTSLTTDNVDFNYYNESPSKIKKDVRDKREFKSSHKSNLQKYMSDDAILKIKDRRDWVRNTTKSEAIHSVYKETSPPFVYGKYPTTSDEMLYSNPPSNICTTNDEESVVAHSARKSPVPDSHKEAAKIINQNRTNKTKRQIQFIESTGTFNEVLDSECEITCHSYNSLNMSSEKPSPVQQYTNNKKAMPSLTARNTCHCQGYHKSAQAILSKDSVDNFISEYGLSIMDDGEKSVLVSKNSDLKECKSVKGSFVRNVISSIFKRRVKPLTASDPGTKIEDGDIEAGFCKYSSSNHNTQCCCQTHIFQESRSSF